jgi:hypothetical protein
MQRVKPMGGAHSQNAGPGLSYLKGEGIPKTRGLGQGDKPHIFGMYPTHGLYPL